MKTAETKISWHTSKRRLRYDERALIMGILNVTPDSFSDGGKFNTLDSALLQAEKMIAEGADILDIGGESTRPSANRTRVSATEETRRVVPIIEAIAKKFDIPISIDTSKSEVAKSAMNAGAEIINDVSGLRFDANIGKVAAETKAGLVLMHLRGSFETMHTQEPVADILKEVSEGFLWSIAEAEKAGVQKEKIALDVGIGFSKTFEQNLELIADLPKICAEFADFPLLIGTSRKSFIGKILDNAPTEARLFGSISSAAIAVFNGAKIVRVHDVKETIEAVKVAEAIKNS